MTTFNCRQQEQPRIVQEVLTKGCKWNGCEAGLAQLDVQGVCAIDVISARTLCHPDTGVADSPDAKSELSIGEDASSGDGRCGGVTGKTVDVPEL